MMPSEAKLNGVDGKRPASTPALDPLSRLVHIFLHSNLSIVLIVFSVLLGLAALYITPREEDPQIIVPLADIYVRFPGHSAAEVEQLVATPLERVLYQIDGVEYVYSQSRENQAIITVRFYVGQDRERSLVKLYKKLDEHGELIPPGVTGWVVKPVEIDDVPIVTLTMTRAGHDSYLLRRMSEELMERLAQLPQVSRAAVIGGESRTVRIRIDADRLHAHGLSPLEVQRTLAGANVILPAGEFTQLDQTVRLDAGLVLSSPDQLRELVVGSVNGQPVLLLDVSEIVDGPAEITNYVRHGWGPARDFPRHHGAPGTLVSSSQNTTDQHAAVSFSANSATEPRLPSDVPLAQSSEPAVTIAISKQKGANAVQVAAQVIEAADRFQDEVLPADTQLTVTRNFGLNADEKVNELIEGLVVAMVIVVLLLTITMGWREALIVSVAVPVVFGLTLAVNMLAGYTINRVTLFALILAIGLLVDDPIVDVENIARHFEEKKRATREIVLNAVAEIRPPLISATLAVIVSFLPMFFITGMMGPYMSPMALNVPVSMLMSMLVAFTITPWLSYHILGHRFGEKAGATGEGSAAEARADNASGGDASPVKHELYDAAAIQQTRLYRFFRPMMLVLLRTRLRAGLFLLAVAFLTVLAVGLAAARYVPLKMLPFDNKNELLLILDLDENATLERTNAVVQELESVLAAEPEVTDYCSYVGVPGPIDFNGLVRHYYLRQAPHLAEIRVNLVGKKQRRQQSHALTLRLRDRLTAIAESARAQLKIVELPPGPPVLAALVAEVTGSPDQSYATLIAAAHTIADRMREEPGVVEVDDTSEALVRKMRFVVDQEKAALSGVAVADISQTLAMSLAGNYDQVLRAEHERHPLRLALQLPRKERSSTAELSELVVKGREGELIPLGELGSWQETFVDSTIYHKNLQRVVYVFAECVGRPPAECVVDITADRQSSQEVASSQASPSNSNAAQPNPSAPLETRTYFRPGSGLSWSVPPGIEVNFAGEGEWDITLDVFRDLGIAFGAAMVMIYVILVAQTGSFMLPLIVMLAVPLTVLGVMPGFWLLNALSGQQVAGYADPVYFTATAMIGMIALAGIVTRDAIILVDFIELSVQSGRSLFDAILESRVVRLRPILLTAGAAMLSALPITLDPIFSGLGWSLIFGLLASTLFTLFVIPATYWLLKADRATSDSL